MSPMLATMLFFSTPSTAALSRREDCRFDHAAMMALDEMVFDQDPLRGFRSLSDHGCRSEAADVIRDYRARHRSSPLYILLTWHEGQVRAADGQIAAALHLFKLSYKRQKDNTDGWNAYVDGTIAFLSNDKRALMAAYNALLSTPKPHEDSFSDWPPNKGPMERMIKCFGKPYSFLAERACGPA